MQWVESLRRNMRRAVATAMIVAFGLTAGASLAAASPAPSQQASSQQTAGVPQTEVDDTGGGIIDRVLLRVSGRAILYSEFEARLQDQLNAIGGQIPQEQIDAQLPQLRQRLMQAMIDEAMLEQRAEELDIRADPNDVDRAIMSIREDNDLLDDNAWMQALAQNGLTEAMMREQAARSIVQQRMMMQEISRQVFVSRREVATYYETNMNQFTEPEQVLYQQIVFAYSGADRSAERELAENALTELRAGVSLTAVGNKYKRPQDVVQDAASASWVAPEDIQPEIRAIIEALTPLSYSDVVEGRFGFHIIQLMDRKEGRTLPLEEVEGGIHDLLTNQKMGARLEEYSSELIKAASLEIYAEEFADIRSLWSEEPEGGATGTPRQRR